jgi:hypothetical protein
MTHVKANWRGASLALKAAAVVGAAGLLATPLLASHSWGGYHWKRTTSQISPRVGDNVTTTWDSYLQTAVNDWNASSVIQSSLVAGSTVRSTCNPVAGTIQVCNYAYGSTGWLGIAQIWLSSGHISQGTTKLNDTYFAQAQYNTPSWRAAVTCQEIGHDYGLGHQDENFNDDRTTSCMEYTSWPAGNEHPDAHDYNQLLAIYNHLEAASNLPGSSASAASAQGIGNRPADWGKAVGVDNHGRGNRYVRELGNGAKVITHVLWAIGEGPDGHDHNLDDHAH